MNTFDTTFDIANRDRLHDPNINVFYHLLCENDGFLRFERTYKKIIKSGLIKKLNNIYVNLVGQNKWVFFNKLILYQKVIPRIGINNDNESETLNLLLNYTKQYTDGYSLYLHSKGVKRTLQPNVCKECIQDWIDCMEFYLIEEHKTALNYLKTHHTCGINLKAAHYSGNFWWASNQYLSTLNPCKNEYLYCEHHFLKANRNNSLHKNLHTTTVQWPGWLKNRYQRHKYTNKQEII